MKLLVFLTLIFLFIQSTVSVVTCPDGFTLVNENKCLKSYSGSSSHLKAELKCRQFGGTLATVKNAIDNRALVTFAAGSNIGYVWLGMYCFGNDFNSCYHDDSKDKLTYRNLGAGYPNERLGRCVYMATMGNKDVGRWLSGPCETAGFAYVCEVPTTMDDTNCSNNYNGYCYLPSHEIPNAASTATFANAQQICQSFLYTLASVHSQQETDYIKSLFGGVNYNATYIGASSFGTSKLQWVDGTNWDYDYTDPLTVSNGSCLVMNTLGRVDGGLWSETDCQSVRHYLCKRPIEGTNLVAPALLQKHIQLDTSQCNSTLYLAPGVVTSLGFPNLHITPAFCTWTIGVLGPYRVGLYFTELSVSDYLNIYDESGNLLAAKDGNLYPFEILAPTNLVTMTHDSSHDHFGDYTGFRAVVLPY